MRLWLFFAMILAATGTGTAQPATGPGLRVDVYAAIDGPTAMAWGPGGAFGDDLYVATGAGDILRVDSTGAATPFATGLEFPTGLAFAEIPAFGELLYVTEFGSGKIRTVDSSGVVEDFLTITGPSVRLADLAFGQDAAGFGTDLYVSDSATAGGVPGKLYRVDPDAGITTVFGTDPFTALDIVFSGSGPFGNGLIVADAIDYGLDNGGVRSFDSAGGFTLLASAIGTDLFDPAGVALGPGGIFGEDLYVADFGTGSIFTVTPTGVLMEFATGFCFGSVGYGYDADLIFNPDGDALLVADRSRRAVYSIVAGEPPCPADCDGSGSLDIFDFLCFQNRLADGDGRADRDGSCSLDIFDFLAFQNEFDAGCP